MTTAPRTLRRALAASVLAAALLLTPAAESVASTRTAETSSTTTSVRAMNRNQLIVVGQVNRARRARDRRAIATNGLMNQRAMRWAARMAACNCLKHRAPPFGAPAGWCGAAENVGRSGNGGTLGDVHTAFMNSGGHRANVLNRTWTDLGVGVARDRAGEYFVVHAFADLAC
jgi:uncharacterized protein YkwD